MKPRGYWQRKIVRMLEHKTAFFLGDLLPPPNRHTSEQFAAINATARVLCDNGAIAVVRWFTEAEQRQGFCVVVYRGAREPDPREIERLTDADRQI